MKGSGLQNGLSALASGPPAAYKSLCPFMARADDLNVPARDHGVYGKLSVPCHGPAASGFPAGVLGLEPFRAGGEGAPKGGEGLRGGGHGG